MNAPPPLQPLRCLIVEDSEDDARLLLCNLHDSGYAVTSERVDTPEAMRAALGRGTWDLIISDYNMPRFSGRAALKLLQSTGQDLPFIVVSGAIGEDLAVETMRAGANDYVMKGRLTRLGPAVARELGEAAKRRAHRRANDTLRLQGAALAAAGNAIMITNRGGDIEWVNPAFTELTGYTLDEACGKNPRDLVKSGRQEQALYQELWTTILAGNIWRGELVNRRKDGTFYHEKQTISPVCGPDGIISHFIAIKQDLTEREKAENMQRENETRFARQRDAVIQLSGARADQQPDLAAAFRSITETSARTLGASRSSIWLFNPDRTAIQCMDLYELATGRHTSGLELSAADYPAYFRALAQMNVVAVEDPRHDPRTREFTDHYLALRGISSMLDAGVHIHGTVEGVLCHEQIGTPRSWKPDEHAFAAALANLVSLALIEAQRRAAEESLRATEQKLRMIIEHSSQLFYTHTPDNVLTYVSPQAREILDCEPAEAMRCWTDFLTDHPENAAGIARTRLAIETGRAQAPYTLELKTKLGRKCWVEARESPVVVAGRTVAIAGALTDITERKQAETALRESERFNRATLDALGAHIAVLDASGRILATNQAWRDFARANAADWTTVSEGANYLEVCERAAATGSADATRIVAGIRAVAGGGKAEWFFEYPCHSPTDERWFYCTVRRFPGEGPVRVVVAHENISPMKQAQAALQESEGRYRLVFDRNPLPMWVYDSGTLAILAANEAAIRNYGYSAEQYRGLSFRELHNPEDVPALLAHLKRSDAGGVSVRETRHRKQDGSIIHAEVFSRPLTYGGRPAQLAMAADITEKKLLQEKFLHAQRLESLGLLAAGIAHDMNNILSPIMMIAPLLRSRLPAESDQKLLGMLEQSARRGAGLVKQILTFAHGKNNEPGPVQLKHLARDITTMIEETFPRNIRFTPDLTPDLWPALANPSQIHQVLLNLCVNARDAMPAGGELRLRVANCELEAAAAAAIPDGRPGRFVLIEVADTGCGIPPDLQTKIWEPFFTTKEADKGTGLGLSTVRGIIGRHRGFGMMTSAVGQGTTFRFYLPAEPDLTGPAGGTTVPFARFDAQGETILIVDDEPDVRSFVSTILTQHGYRTLAARNGDDALEVFQAHQDDIRLVMTDGHMPGLPPADLIAALRRRQPGIRILVCTGLIDPAVPGVPAEETLMKPFEPGTLLATVHRLLRSP